MGNPASIHIYNYVKNVLCKEGYDVTIYYYCSEEKLVLRDEVSAFYDQYEVKLVRGYNPADYGKFSFFKYHKKTVRLLKSLGPFDILHELYIWYYISPAIYRVRHLYKKIVLTYFGSDLYRNSFIERIMTVPSLAAADNITLISTDMMDYFKKSPSYLRRYLKKCSIVDLGNMFYDRIAKLSRNRGFCKSSLGFNPSKTLITIGYVGRPQMRQYETLKTLLSDTRILNLQVQFAVPAYGISEENYNKIQSLVKDTGTKIIVFRDFMDAEKVSSLRAATDIFIHAQTTDALSCAMLEHLFAGSIVVNGSWLQYGTLMDKNVYYKSFDKFASLSEEIIRIIDNIDKEKDLSSHNREIISQISSWDGLRPLWLKQYS